MHCMHACYIHTCRHSVTQLQYRHVDMQASRCTHVQAYTPTDADMQQTCRHADMHTYRRTEIQTYRHTVTHKHTLHDIAVHYNHNHGHNYNNNYHDITSDYIILLHTYTALHHNTLQYININL